MPTATQPHITPTRRSAIGFSLAAMAAGLTVPALASEAATPDTDLVRLCNRLVATEAEIWLLAEHDEHAPDFGPNRAHYDQLTAERNCLKALVDECGHPVSTVGTVAVARVALTWVERDDRGEAICDHFDEEMMLRLAERVAVGFVWPPRPGDCSTAHWAPPTSAKEIAEHDAARRARLAKVNAKVKAEKEAKEAEERRLKTPSLLTDDELRGKFDSWRMLKTLSDKVFGEITDEIARRGLVA